MISVAAPDLSHVLTIEEGEKYVLNYPCDENNNDCFPYTVNLKKGKYKIECWGASGHRNKNIDLSKGAYTSGIITIEQYTILYFYIGNVGVLGASSSYNGGGAGCETGHSGGGATDVRLVYTPDPTDFAGLLSRIMVAGGAGGYSNRYNTGSKGIGRANAGTIDGDFGFYETDPHYTTHNLTYSTGGKQDSPGVGSYCAKEECMDKMFQKKLHLVKVKIQMIGKKLLEEAVDTLEEVVVHQIII